MNTTNNIHPSGAEVFEATSGGLRVLEIALIVLFGLLICPPLLILVVVVALPVIVTAAVVAVIVAAVAVPAALVRRVRAHHRAHGSTLFLHRLLRRRHDGPTS